MKRLFLDANVLFTAAHNPSGKASLLISLGTDCLLQLATSAYAKEEAHRNLMRKFPHCLDRFEAIKAPFTWLEMMKRSFARLSCRTKTGRSIGQPMPVELTCYSRVIFAISALS